MHTGPISSVALTPDGALFTAAYDPDAVLWRADGGLAPVARFHVADKNVNAAAASPCGRWLATGSSDGVAALVERETGRVLPLHHPGDVETVAFSVDGERLASGGTDGTVRVFATDDGTLLGLLPHRGKTVGALRYLGDGTLLTVCNDGLLRAWSPDCSLAWSLALSPLPLKSLAVVGDHAFVGGHDTVVRSVHLHMRGTAEVFRLTTTPKAMAADGTRLVLAGYDDTVRVADLAEWRGGPLHFVTVAKAPGIWSHGVDIRGDLLAVGSFGGAPRAWHHGPDGWVVVPAPDAPVPCVSSATFAGDGIVSAGDSGVVWDGARVVASLGEAVTSIRSFEPLPSTRSLVPELRASGYGLVATTWSGNAHVLLNASHRVHRVAEGPIVCGEVDGDVLVAGLYTGGVVCIGIEDGGVRWHSHDAIGAVKSVHVHGDLVAVVGRYDPLRILDRRTGETLARLPLETNVSDIVRFDPTGALLACAAGDHEVWFVRVGQGAGVTLEVVAHRPGHERPIKALAWTDDGAVLAGDYAGRVLRHTAGGPSACVASTSPILGVSALLIRGDHLVVTSFDGHLVTLPLRSAA